MTQLNEKLTSKVKSLETSLAETKKTLSTTQDELAKKVEAEKRQSEEKAVPMQVEKPVEAPTVAAATATGFKETEEEVKKWKSEAKRMRSRAEEKEIEREFSGDDDHLSLGRRIDRAFPPLYRCQSPRSRRISKPKSRSPKKPWLKQNDEPLPQP